MKILEQKIPGTYLIQPEPFEDERGRFRRAFCCEEFSKKGIPFQIKQTNFSENKTQGTLRGIHFRKEILPESKVLTCVRGKIFNVIVDLRRKSPMFGKWISLELSAENGWAVYLPHGCANGFLTLEADTAVHYYHGSVYQNGADTGVAYDDPYFGIQWPFAPNVISEKDKTYEKFDPLVGGVI